MPNGNRTNNKTRKVKRVGFSNNKPNFFGVSFKNKNLNRNLARSMIESRKGNRGISRRRSNIAPVRLNEKESKLLANFSSASANSQQMLGHIQKLQFYLMAQSDPEFAGFAPSIQLDPAQRKLFDRLYAINTRVEKMEAILDKLKNRILSTYE